jgi:hypothetical protein
MSDSTALLELILTLSKIQFQYPWNPQTLRILILMKLRLPENHIQGQQSSSIVVSVLISRIVETALADDI